MFNDRRLPKKNPWPQPVQWEFPKLVDHGRTIHKFPNRHGGTGCGSRWSATGRTRIDRPDCHRSTTLFLLFLFLAKILCSSSNKAFPRCVDGRRPSADSAGRGLIVRVRQIDAHFDRPRTSGTIVQAVRSACSILRPQEFFSSFLTLFLACRHSR